MSKTKPKDAFQTLPPEIQKQILAKAKEQVRSEVHEEIRSEERAKAQAEFKKSDISSLVNRYHDLEFKRQEKAEIMATAKKHLVPDPNATNPKKARLIDDMKFWTEDQKKAKEEYDEISEKIEILLNESYLTVSLANNPFGDEPYLSGAVNGKSYQIYNQDVNQDGKAVKTMITLGHYVSLLKDQTKDSLPQAGVFTWRTEGENEDGTRKNVPYVKSVMLSSSIASDKEIAKHKREKSNRAPRRQGFDNQEEGAA